MYADDHVPTDPACRFHVPPTTWRSRRQHSRARGIPCPRCVPPRPPQGDSGVSKPTYDIGRDNLIAIKEELALLRAMDVVRARLKDFMATGEEEMKTPDMAYRAYRRGYRNALAHVLSDLGRSSNGSMTPTFRISSPSEREQP